MHRGSFIQTRTHVLGLALVIGGLVLAGCHPLVRATPTPGIPPLVIADFDTCQRTNNLGGEMGAAYNSPDRLTESYIPEAGRGCVARLEYQVTGWAAFWLKLGGADLRSYSALTFDVRADGEAGIPGQIKVELKRGNGELLISQVTGIGPDWQPVRIPLADLRPTSHNPPLASFAGIDELVFTFEAGQAGRQGVVYLDDIRVE